MEESTKYTAIGRRKESTARVELKAGKGDIVVNGLAFDKYFNRETDKIIATQPLQATNNLTRFNITANVAGGGLTGQAGALRHGIARALVSCDIALKDLLRKNGFLSRDPRMKERKKYGQKGARKRFQWTKR